MRASRSVRVFVRDLQEVLHGTAMVLGYAVLILAAFMVFHGFIGG